MNKSPINKEIIPLTVAELMWGITHADIQDMRSDDTEAQCMRQIIVNKLAEEGYTHKQISAIIDRSEITVQVDIDIHEQEIEDGYEGYVEGVDAFDEMFDKIVRRRADKVLYELGN